MSDIEGIAMVLSKSSKTVADWKLKFPTLHEAMKAKLSADMEKVTINNRLTSYIKYNQGNNFKIWNKKVVLAGSKHYVCVKKNQ